MIASIDVLTPRLLALIVPLLACAAGLVFLVIKYTLVIGRNFEKQPLFMPLRVQPVELGESVEFQTEDGLRLSGSYFRKRTEELAGILVYCHEYLSNRWSFHPYIDHLQSIPDMTFSFDFRNHGASDHGRVFADAVDIDREIRDLRGQPAYPAVACRSRSGGFRIIRSESRWDRQLDRPRSSPASGESSPMGPFRREGPWSRTPSAGRKSTSEIPLCSACCQAGSTHSWPGLPRRWSEQPAELSLSRCGVIGRARLAPRPWLMIHGERDAYIGPEIARELFAREMVPRSFGCRGAKHNRCRDCDPEAYADHLTDFLDRFAPPSAAQGTERGTLWSSRRMPRFRANSIVNWRRRDSG